MDTLRLEALLDERIDARFKGFSPTLFGRPLRDVVADRPSVFGPEFTPPLMVLRRTAMEHDISTMARYCSEHDVLLAPHGKTTLAPQLFAEQLAAGAWAITVATPSQVALARSFRVPRVLLANELVDAGTARWVLDQLDEDAEFEFLCYVDSVDGVRILADAFADRPRDRGFDVLVEMGPAGGRTGRRTVDEAVSVAEAVHHTDGVHLVGIAGYEGGIGHDLVPEVFARVREFLALMRETAERLLASGLVSRTDGTVLLSAGGSVFYDDVIAVLSPALADGTPVRCVVRAGSYVSHDSGLYQAISPFTRPGADGGWSFLPAIEVWGQVLSVPEPGLALVLLGKRDAAFDEGMPIPKRVRRAATGEEVDASDLVVAQLNDQHAFVRVPPGRTLTPGDWLMCGISHPCTQFDKWHAIPVVDDEHRVVDVIRTFF